MKDTVNPPPSDEAIRDLRIRKQAAMGKIMVMLTEFSDEEAIYILDAVKKFISE